MFKNVPELKVYSEKITEILYTQEWESAIKSHK